MREGIGYRVPVGTPKQREQAIAHCGKHMCGISLRGMPGIFAKRDIPTLSAVIRLLSNPAYAGAYVYGRWKYSGETRSPTTGKARPHLRGAADWPVCLHNHHDAYLSWEEYVQNRAQLRHNWYREGQRGAVREGTALLQGIVLCGICGRKMSVQHHAARERRAPTYLCAQGYHDGERHICQSMTARPVDAAVVAAFLEAVAPLQLDVVKSQALLPPTIIKLAG